MKSKLIYDENGLKTWVLVFDKDDEVKKSLLRFASENRLRGAQITAIGAFSEATLGFFDREKKSYQEIPIKTSGGPLFCREQPWHFHVREHSHPI
jgi:uncharacterized protein